MNDLNSKLTQLLSDKGENILNKTLTGDLDLKPIGPFPLSRMTSLKDASVNTSFDSGELRFELSSVNVSPVKISHSSNTPGDSKNKAQLSITLAPMTLQANYHLFAIEQPKLDLDTGGSLMPLSQSNDGDPPTITVEEFDQLTQARQQRSILQTTSNGQIVLSAYNTHNDAYNQIFQTNKQLQAHWKASGATAEMAAYTSTALTNGQTINPSSATKTFGSQGIAYNDNAFQQQTYVFSACMGAKQFDAGLAATQFSSFVQTTGNTQSNPNSMVGDAVYSHVNSASASDLQKLVNPPQANDMHNALHRIAQNTHTDDDLSLLSSQGYALSDSTIKGMQAIHAEALHQDKPENKASLWQGELNATFPESQFVFSIQDHDAGAIATSLIRHTLATPHLEIDDAKWDGEAGKIARKRFSSVHFLRSMLLARIRNQIEQQVAQCVSSFINKS